MHIPLVILYASAQHDHVMRFLSVTTGDPGVIFLLSERNRNAWKPIQELGVAIPEVYVTWLLIGLRGNGGRVPATPSLSKSA